MASDPWAVVSSESADPWAVVGQDEGDTGNATLSDYGNMLTRGLAGVTGAVGQGVEFVGEATGIDAIAKSGRKTREDAAERQRILTSYMTPGARQRRDNQVVVEKPGSAPPPMELGKGRAWFDNLEFGPTPVSSALLQSAESLPGMAATMAVGGPMSAGLKKIGGEALKKVAAKEGAVGAVAKVAPTAVGYGAAEGAFAGLQNASQIRGEIEKIPVERLRGVPAFDAEVEATDSALPIQERELLARNEIARKASVDVATRTALSTGLIGMATGGGALGAIHRGAGAPVKDGIIKSTIKGAASEAPQETMQSGAEAYISNLATQKYIDPSINPMDGVVGQAVSGGIVGAATGGVFGAGGVMIPSRSRTSNGWDVVRETPDANAPDIDDQDLVDQIKAQMGEDIITSNQPQQDAVTPSSETVSEANNADIPSHEMPGGEVMEGAAHTDTQVTETPDILSKTGQHFQTPQMAELYAKVNKIQDAVPVSVGADKWVLRQEPKITPDQEAELATLLKAKIGDKVDNAPQVDTSKVVNATNSLRPNTLPAKDGVVPQASAPQAQTGEAFVAEAQQQKTEGLKANEQSYDGGSSITGAAQPGLGDPGAISGRSGVTGVAAHSGTPMATGRDDVSATVESANAQHALITPDRRTDTATRKLIDEMTPAEMRALLKLNPLTGLGSRLSYEENKSKFPVQGAIDADSLKWINDNMSPGSGDKMLKAVADAIKDVTDNGFHIGGDEYFVLGKSQEEIDAIAEKVQSRLKNAVIRLEKPDGSIIVKRGIEVTHGTGQDKDTAEYALKQRKVEREKSGLRAGRGEQPPGVSKIPPAGKQDTERGIAGEVDQQTPEKDGAVPDAIAKMADAVSKLADKVDAISKESAPAPERDNVEAREYPSAAIEERRSTSDWPLAINGWRIVGGGRNVPGFSSEAAAKIEISKNPTWKASNATIIPFDYFDGSVTGRNADLRARYAILVKDDVFKGLMDSRDNAPTKQAKAGASEPVEKSQNSMQKKDPDADLLTEQAPKHQTKGDLKSYLRGRLGREKADELIESGAVDRAWDGRDGAPLFSRSQIPGTIEIDGVQRPTRNSKGQLIHPTEEGIRNFWKWFKNSRVVDDKGRPLVVYHGTKENFDSFSERVLGSSTQAQSAKKGFFFAASPSTTDAYSTAPNLSSLSPANLRKIEHKVARMRAADNRLDNAESELVAYGKGDYISASKEVRSSMEDEYRAKGHDVLLAAAEEYKKAEVQVLDSRIEEGALTMPVYLKVEKPSINDQEGKKYREISYNQILMEALNNGNDGAIIKNTYDGMYMDDIYIAFSSHQIKSATGNTGAFSPSDANILKSVGDKKITTPHTIESATSAILDAHTGREKEAIQAMMDAGKVRAVTADQAALVVGKDSLYSGESGATAIFNPPDGITYFIADHMRRDLTPQEIKGLVRHEISVHALQLGKDSKEFKDILKTLDVMRRAGNKKVIEAYQRAKDAGTREADVSHEQLAYLVQYSPDLPIVRRFVAWLKNAIRNLGKDFPIAQKLRIHAWANTLAVDDVLYMAQTALAKSYKSGDVEVRTEGRGSVLASFAYHGSPHKFDKFDMSKIGTGEGAQAYGHGLYFAESPEVAKGYAQANRGRGAASTGLIDSLPKPAQVEVYKAMQMPDGWLRDAHISDIIKRHPSSKDVFDAMRANFYKVDIPDEAIARMLDWDKPLSEQSKEVRAAISDIIRQRPGSPRYWLDKFGENPKGSRIVNELRLSGGGSFENALKAQGIPGIRYLDGDSRGKGGTSNYVIFDDSLPRILEINGVPTGAVPYADEKKASTAAYSMGSSDGAPLFSRSPSATADDTVGRDETASDTADKVDAASIVGDRFTLPAETRRDKARRKIQDDAIRIQKVQDAVVEQGGEITEESNIAEAIKLYPGRLAERLADLNKKIVEPLLERMAKTGITMDDVGLYMYALHAKERNAEIAKIRKDLPNDGKPGNSGSGMTDAMADDIIKQAEAHPQFKSIQSASNVLNKIIAARLTMLVKEGVMSKDQADAYRAQYKHYVPLKGFEKADVNGVPQGAGRGISTGRKIDFRALGRKSMAKDIFQNIIRDAGSAMMLAEKAKVGRVARKFVEANPDTKLWNVDKIPKDRHFSKGQSVHNVYEHGSLVGEFAHPKDANDYATYLRGKPGAAKQDVYVKSERLHPNGLVILKDAQFDPNEEIMFIEGSDVVRIQFTDPLMTRAYNRLWNNGVSDGLKLLNDYNSLLRQMYTQKNPAWFILNAFRDVQAVVPYLAGEKGAKFAFKAVGNMLGAKKAAWNFFHKKPLSKEWADVMERYRRAGGTVGFAYVGDVEAKTLELEGALSRYTSWNSTIQTLKQGEIKKGMHDVLTKTLNSKAFAWIEALNTSFENMSRLATFKAAIDSGLSDQEGAMLSKHVTVNFNTRGEWGPNMNAVWLFSNASVQGSRNIGHALLYSKHKGQVWALAGGLTAVGVMAGLMGDDDDDLVRDDERGKSLIFKFGDTTIKWPMPYGWGFFGGLGQLIAQTMKHPENHDKIAIEMADLTMQHFGVIGNPFAGASNDLVGTVNMLPTAAKPWAQAAVNRSSFGGPLYPESPFDETTPDSEKAWRTTKGSAYDMTAKWLNDVSGGDSVQEGFVDWSPESIKLGVTTITGGVGRLVADLFSLPFKATSDEDMSPKDFPVIKNFIGEISTDEHKRRFYEQSSKAKEAYIIYKNYQKKGDVESADAYLAENNAIVALGSMVESYQKTLKQLRENEDRVKNDASLSSDRRKTELKLIESRIIGTTKEFNDNIKGIDG